VVIINVINTVPCTLTVVVCKMQKWSLRKKDNERSMCIEAWNWAWKVEGLTPTRKLVLLAIADYADPHTKKAYPSNGHLAQRVGLKDPKGVQRIIKELEELGHVKRTPRYKNEIKGQTSNYITCLIPDGLINTPPHRLDALPPTDRAHPNTLEDTKDKPRNSKERIAEELLFSIKEIYQTHFPDHKQKNVSSEHQTLIVSLLKKPPRFEDEGQLKKQPVDDTQWWEEYLSFCALSDQLVNGWQFEDKRKIPDLEFLIRRRTLGKVFNLDYHPQLKGAKK